MVRNDADNASYTYKQVCCNQFGHFLLNHLGLMFFLQEFCSLFTLLIKLYKVFKVKHKSKEYFYNLTYSKKYFSQELLQAAARVRLNFFIIKYGEGLSQVKFFCPIINQIYLLLTTLRQF